MSSTIKRGGDGGNKKVDLVNSLYLVYNIFGQKGLIFFLRTDFCDI